MVRLRITIRQAQEELFQKYCDLTLNHPKKIIFFTLLFSTLISAAGFYWYFTVFNFDPSVGFETRGTTLSKGRLLLDSLKKYAASPLDLYGSLKHVKHRKFKREIQEIANSTPTYIRKSLSPPTTLEPITVDYNDYGVGYEPNEQDLSDACVQYSAMGKRVPYQYMDYFVKIIVEIQEPDKLFTLPVFQKLCKIDNIIERTINRTGFAKATTVFKHSFNLPLMATCLNFTTPNECDALNMEDIINLKDTIRLCTTTPTDEICKTDIMLQAKHYLLPLDDDFRFVSIVLPLTVSINKDSSGFYEELLDNLRDFYTQDVILKGVYFNMKDMEFFDAIKHDTILALFSAVLVFSCFLIYSRSIFFTFIILAIIVLSMGISFTMYTAVMSIEFFPFLNLLVLVLMIAIGADDAFLLLNYHRQEVQKHSNPWRPGDLYLPPESRHRRCLRLSLSHSLMSMFITSATTAVAFLSNFTSDVLVLRCFGVYASLTVIVNYILVLLILPSTLVITTASEFFDGFNFYKDRKKKYSEYISRFVINFKYFIIIISCIALILSSIIVFYSPGLQIPKYNPTKVLTSSDPSEWYDDNSHLFDFQWKRSAHLLEYYIIGDLEIKNSISLSPYQKGSFKAQTLHLSNIQLDLIEEGIEELMLGNGFANYTSWLSKFKQRSSCSNFSEIAALPSSCFVSFSIQNMPSAFPDDFAVLPSDGPIFDKKLNLIGYFIAVPTDMVLSSDAQNVERLFTQIDEHCVRLNDILDISYNVQCMSSSDIDRYYDILNEIKPSTIQSVIISILVSLVVVIFCTRRIFLSIFAIIVISTVIICTIAVLILLGWQLSVVESTILILTIGLSFDFSLHMVAGLREKEVLLKKIRNSLSSAGSACTLASLTSVLCGLPLLFANTAAFLQVGTMLITLGIISLFGACLLLPAVIAASSRKTKITTVTHF